jgi:hypothetical protein
VRQAVVSSATIRLLTATAFSSEMEDHSNNVIMCIWFYTAELRELSKDSALNVHVIPFVNEIQGK